MIASISKPETLPCVLHLGDCLEVMRGMADNSVDAVVTDPPYGLSFMGKHWDHGVPGEAFWREVLRVAKPGAHLLAFGGTRTYHRLACAIEDAGWEIRDCVMWVYGSGFPKSHDVSKAIDKAAGAEREVLGSYTVGGTAAKGKHKGRAAADADEGSAVECSKELSIIAPATDAARQWSGWGTALKPAWEPIIVARKSLGGTVAENVLAHGTGGINVDGCRVGNDIRLNQPSGTPGAGRMRVCNQIDRGDGKTPDGRNLANLIAYVARSKNRKPQEVLGRWPANLIHDDSDEVTDLLGSAARFFYCAKASKRDRDEGCEGLEEKVASIGNVDGGSGRDGSNPNNNWKDSCKRRVQQGLPPTMPRRNHHPTVKPTDLMRYLCRLVTPPGGVVLDPFMGSGSTGKAAILEGFQFVGIEQEPEYLEIARARIAYVQPESGKSCTTQAYAPAKPKRPDTGQLSLF